MLQIYTGTPGSGKSLHLAKDIHFWLRLGINIIANFEINLDLIKRCKGKFTYIETEKLTVNFLKNYALMNHDFKSKKEFQTQIIIDEASDIFNCRDIRRRDRASWLLFFRQHRKYRYDVLLTTQDDKEIDRQIRNKIEEEIRHRKLNNYGFIGSMLSLLSFNKFKLFIAIKFWKGNHMRTGVDYFIYRKKYGMLYDTFKLFSDDEFKMLLTEGERSGAPLSVTGNYQEREVTNNNVKKSNLRIYDSHNNIIDFSYKTS